MKINLVLLLASLLTHYVLGVVFRETVKFSWMKDSIYMGKFMGAKSK